MIQSTDANMSTISYNDIVLSAEKYKKNIRETSILDSNSKKLSSGIDRLLTSSQKTASMVEKLSIDNRKRANFTNIPDRAKEIRKARIIKLAKEKSKLDISPIMSIEKNVGKILRVLQTRLKVPIKKSKESMADYDTKKLGGKEWKASFFSAISSAFRQMSLEGLSVDQESHFQSRFGEKDKQKGILASTIRAYKLATDETTLSVQEKMLKALLDMSRSISGPESVFKLVADRLLIEHASLRTIVFGLKLIERKLTFRFRVYNWMTKARGGYKSKLPHARMGSAEHTASVLDMIYVDSMWRLDNIVHHLKQQYNLWNSYVHNQTGTRGESLTDVQDGRYRFFPKLTTILSNLKEKYIDRPKEIPEYERYVITAKDLSEQHIEIAKAQLKVSKSNLDIYESYSSMQSDLLKRIMINTTFDKDKKHILSQLYDKKLKDVGTTNKDLLHKVDKVKMVSGIKQHQDDKFILDKEHPNRLLIWKAKRKFELDNEKKFEKMKDKIEKEKEKINNRLILKRAALKLKIYKRNKAEKFRKMKEDTEEREKNLTIFQKFAQRNRMILRKKIYENNKDIKVSSYRKDMYNTQVEELKQTWTNHPVNRIIKSKPVQDVKDIVQLQSLKDIGKHVIDTGKSGVKGTFGFVKNQFNQKVKDVKDKGGTVEGSTILKLDQLIRIGMEGVRLKRSGNKIAYDQWLSSTRLGRWFKKGKESKTWGFIKKISSWVITKIGGFFTMLMTFLGGSLLFQGVKKAIAGSAAKIGTSVLNLGARGLAGAGGVLMGAWDGFRATRKAKEWKTSKTIAGAGGFLGGSGDGGTMSAIAGAAKGAAIGTLIFPGIGTAIGGIAGAVLGAIGGKNIAKSLDHIWTGLKGAFKLLLNALTFPFRMVKWITEKIKGGFKSIWGDIKNLPSKISNWVSGLIPNWARKLLGMKSKEQAKKEKAKKELNTWNKNKKGKIDLNDPANIRKINNIQVHGAGVLRTASEKIEINKKDPILIQERLRIKAEKFKNNPSVQKVATKIKDYGKSFFYKHPALYNEWTKNKNKFITTYPDLAQTLNLEKVSKFDKIKHTIKGWTATQKISFSNFFPKLAKKLGIKEDTLLEKIPKNVKLQQFLGKHPNLKLVYDDVKKGIVDYRKNHPTFDTNLTNTENKIKKFHKDNPTLKIYKKNMEKKHPVLTKKIKDIKESVIQKSKSGLVIIKEQNPYEKNHQI